jgi:hypothetical protein
MTTSRALGARDAITDSATVSVPPRLTGCAFGCALDHHDPSCLLADLADRPSIDYADTGVFVMAEGRPVLVSLREFNAMHRVPRQREAAA